MFVNYAHRGASFYAPENTEPSFDLGIGMKANGIETDLQITKDGKIVLFHNDLIDERSSGKGEIKDYTWEELQEFDFGSWKNEKYTGTKLMLFEDFAKKYGKTDLIFAIEIKKPGFEKQALEMIAKYFNRENVIVTSFIYESLVSAREADKTIRLGWLTGEINEETIAAVKKIDGYQICPRITNTGAENVALAHANGLDVRVWGIASEDLMRKAYSLDISGMTVDFPDKLQKLMEESPRA